MSDDPAAIRIEPLGFEGEGAEFWLDTSTGREYHQVKRQTPQGGHWSIKQDPFKRILNNFRAKLQARTDARCVFVSQDGARDLRDLIDRAKRAESFAEFEEHQLLGHAKVEFQDLLKVWGDIQPEEAFQFLTRILIDPIGERNLLDLVDGKIERLLNDGVGAREILASLAYESVNKRLDANAIWRHLESKGGSRYQPAQWSENPRARAALSESLDRLLAGAKRDAILQKPIHRREADEIVAHLMDGDGERIAVASGEAGAGKSGVIAQVASRIHQIGWNVLALQLDLLETYDSNRRIGKDLFGIDVSPAHLLGKVSAGNQALLIIDQLDAASQISGRQPRHFELAEELIRQALQYDGIRILVGCRAYDLNQDPRLRQLFQSHTQGRMSAKVFEVDPLDASDVKSVLLDLGYEAEVFSASQMSLLSRPIYLRLLSDIEHTSQNSPIASGIQLYDAFWDSMQRRTTDQCIRI